MHLVIDGHGVARHVLEDKELISGFLDRYPDNLGMTKLIAPQVYTYRGPKPEDWGISGFVIIAESHISIHTFPERGYVNIDVFSCKDFDAEAAVDELRRTFELTEIRHWVLPRGVEYSDPLSAQQAITSERSELSGRLETR